MSLPAHLDQNLVRGCRGLSIGIADMIPLTLLIYICCGSFWKSLCMPRILHFSVKIVGGYDIFIEQIYLGKTIAIEIRLTSTAAN